MNSDIKNLFGGLYAGKKVLVTGHTGFKGSWLTLWLKEMGAEVIGYALDPYTESDNFVLSGLAEQVTDIRGDVRDYDTLKRVFDEYKPEIVFHLAAQPLVRLSYSCPKETFDTNTGGTVNVLEAVRTTDSVKVAVMITTDKCYENREIKYGYKEEDAMGGHDPYSASKGAAEIVIGGYRRSYGSPNKIISSVRAGNVIGGGDWSLDRLIPDCITAISRGEVIEVRNPFSTRPWQHVLEPLGGYLLLGARMWQFGEEYSGAWNFGPEEACVVEVHEITDTLIKCMGAGEWKDVSSDGGHHEAKLLGLDCTKAYTRLGWRQALTIDESIELTANWYKQYQLENAYDICKQQIQFYLSKVSKDIFYK